MHIMDSQNVVGVKHNVISSIQSMQASFSEGIVDNAQKEFAVSLNDLHPEIFAPAT